MAKNKMICTKNEVDYLSIRKAMTSGARTIDELVELIQNIIDLGR